MATRLPERLSSDPKHQVLLRTILIAVVALLGAMREVGRAQTCSSETAGGGGFLSQCSVPGSSVPIRIGPTTPGGGLYFIDHIGGGIPDAGGAGPGVDTVLSMSGTWSEASGEFRLPVQFATVEGVSPNSGFSAFATYRSYFATGAGDVDATGDLPFGAGWLAGFGDGLLAGATPGGQVEWVDHLGATWEFTNPLGITDPYAPESIIWVYGTHQGSRLLNWDGIFYRELPDHTLIEYEPKPGNGPIGYRVKRIFRGDRTTPRWVVNFVYEDVDAPNGVYRLARIEGFRGYDLEFTWSGIAVGQQTQWRITKISVANPDLPSANFAAFDVVLTYDGQARLYEVRYPERSLHYDSSGNGAVAALASFKAEGLRFGYASDHSLTTVWRLLKTSDWSAPVVETALQNTYEDGQPWPTWQLKQQIERPGADQRKHVFSHPAGQTLRWVDPLDIQHDFVHTGTGSPTTWHVTSYSRNPLHSDPDGHGKLTWDFSWDSCSCGRLTSIQLPSGRRMEMDYDTSGRGLLTAVRLKTSSTDTDPRVWFLDYEDWGYPWNAVGVFDRASRIKEFRYKDEAGNLVAWPLEYTHISAGAGTTDVKIPKPDQPGQFFVYTVHEDALQRVTKIEEPEHAVDGTQSTERSTTEFHYGTTSNLPGYLSLESVVHYRPDPDTGNLLPVATMRGYDDLARVVTFTDEHSRDTTFSYDNANNILSVTPPSATSGKDPNKQIASGVAIDWGLFGEPVRIKSQANTADGAAYVKPEVVRETASDFFGEPTEHRVDAEKMDTVNQLWLLSKRRYDKLGRVIEAEGPSGSMTRYVVNDFDLISEVRFRETVGQPESSWPKRTINYNVEGKRTRYEDASGLVLDYEYDPHGRLAKIKHAASGKEIRVLYPREFGTQVQGSLGLPKKVQYWVGTNQSTERIWSRDFLGRLTGQQFIDVPGGATTSDTFDYNGYTRLASVSDNNGRGKTYAYDKAGLIKWIEDSLSANDKNRVEVKRNLQAQVIEFLRKVQKEDDQGAFTQVTYKTGFVYDELGRATVVERYGRSPTKQAERRFGYDSLGRTTWLQKQLETSVFQDFEWNYDALGRVRETIRHAKTGATGTITTTSDYDDIPAAYGNDGFGTPLDASNLSRVIKRHDARGLETTYLYDLLGRLVERRMPGYTTAGAGFSWTYRHDAEGRVDKWKDGNGHVIGVTRNSEKFPIQRHIESLGTGSALSEMTKWEKWDYDSLARKVTYRTYNGPLDPSTYPPGTGDAWLVDVVREFDALGRLKAEEFGYGDNGTSTDSRVHKRLTSSYAYGGNSDDTGFRRGLSLPSNWDFGFTPDGAGKTSQITLKGPNDASAGLAAHYRYEGGRAHLRDWNVDPTNQQSLGFRTTWDTSELGYETHLTTVRDPSGSPTTVFDLEQGRDLEGNVLWKKYAKQVGGGDWFQNDGWNRLDEAKLGAPASDFGQGKTYAQAGFDTKLAYAMDVAHNRTSVTETQGGNSTTTNYSVDTASNRYLDAGSGTLTYDLNGNLVFDGYRLYVYDYLDRLCEVWDYYDGTASSSSSTTTRKPVKLSLTQVRDLANTHRRDAYSRDVTKHGLSDYNKSTDNGRNLTSSSQSSSGPSFVLTALYGYDGMNRRTFRTTTATSEGLRYSTWDGWRMAEEYEDDGTPTFSVRKVYFDGIGIDGHLGYATSSDGMNWTRYSLVQDSLGHVMAVYKVGESTAIEKYEYDPYGNRTIYVRNAQGQYDLALSTTVSNTYGFTGRRHDPETGFVYYRLRYYSPGMGRFITQDPIGNWGDGANWGNAQAYVGSAPAAASDPFGLLTYYGGGGGASAGPLSSAGSLGPGGSSMPGANGQGAGGGDGGRTRGSMRRGGWTCGSTRPMIAMMLADDLDDLLEEGNRLFKEWNRLSTKIGGLKDEIRAARQYYNMMKRLGSGSSRRGWLILKECNPLNKQALPLGFSWEDLAWALGILVGNTLLEPPDPDETVSKVERKNKPEIEDLERERTDVGEQIDEIWEKIKKHLK